MTPSRTGADRLPISFIWLFEGSVRLPTAANAEDFFNRLEMILVDQEVGSIRESATFVRFEDSLLRLGSNWKTLAIFDSGWAWLDVGADGPKIRYRVRCFQGFVFVCFAACLFGAFGYSSEGVEGLKVGAAAFLWLYGMNLFLAAFRVPLLFRRPIEETA